MALTCVHCHSPIPPNPTGRRRFRYCSKECTVQHRLGLLKEQRQLNRKRHLCLDCFAPLKGADPRSTRCRPCLRKKERADRLDYSKRMILDYKKKHPRCCPYCHSIIPPSRQRHAKTCGSAPCEKARVRAYKQRK